MTLWKRAPPNETAIFTSSNVTIKIEVKDEYRFEDLEKEIQQQINEPSVALTDAQFETHERFDTMSMHNFNCYI